MKNLTIIVVKNNIEMFRLISYKGLLVLIFLVLLLMPRAAMADIMQEFVVAAYNGDLLRVNEILAKGVNVNKRLNNNDYTVLILASQKGHTEIVEALLAKGADVNAKANDGSTAFLWANVNGHTEIVKALLAKGVNVNEKARKNGMTALIAASQNGHTEIVEALLAKGADVNAKEDRGYTALVFASNTEIENLLIEKGANTKISIKQNIQMRDLDMVK
jgi:ankyrin repeat protein